MKNLRTRLQTRHGTEAGLSLVEILVAMLVFALIAVGVAAGLTASLTITRDNKARSIAANLAASEIDRVRAIGNPFDVFNRRQDITVGSSEGIYDVKTEQSWVTPTGDVKTCGTPGGPLQYKRVTVEVRWPGMRDDASPVRSDTLLAPSSRINDPTKGTILVSVTDARGIGKAGVTFTVTPSTGLGVIVPTDADGCSFILEAPAGSYTVKLTGTGMLDNGPLDGIQRASPTDTKTVVIGSSTAFAFQYDTSMRYNLNFASNVTGPRPLVPTNLQYTFINTYGVYTVAATGSGSSWSANLHPYPDGYQAIAGRYVGTDPSCKSVDPESWAADTRVTPAREGKRERQITGSPGGTDTINVPMGVLKATGGGTQRWLTAVSQPNVPIPGQPECANTPTTTMSYDFGSIFPNTGTATATVALPFGSWKLFTRASATGALVPYAGAITLVTAGQPADATGVFALDPR